MLIRVILLALVSAVGMNADPPPQPPPYPNGVRLLIPVMPDFTVGSAGTIWEGRVFIHNRSDVDVMVLAGIGVRIPADSTVRVESLNGPHGLLLFAQPEDAPFISVEAEVEENSGLYRVPPQRVRAVPDSALVRDTAEILGVELDGSRRCALRIFDPARMPERSFEVRVYQVGESRPDVLVSTISVVTEAPPISEYWPGYVALSLDDMVGAAGPVRIEVVASGADGFWCIASSTDNATQEFRIFEPAAGLWEEARGIVANR
ncbi:MAG: hypothetical protein ACSLFQ_04735 [Thermoanaerobaculia bacterium]